MGYGDNQGNGRGLYSVDVSNKSIQAKLIYPCEMKPGAIITTDNRLYMSYLGNNKEPGILTFSLDEAFNLTFLNKQTIPFLLHHLVVLIIRIICSVRHFMMVSMWFLKLQMKFR